MTMMPLIVNLTPTGMIPTKSMTPHVPISVPEIVDEVLACHDVGITMVHLHARDEEGRPTYRADVYRRLIEGIRQHAPELVICVSLSGRNVREFEKRAEPLGLAGPLKPDMGSLTLSSMNFSGRASVNEPEVIQALAKEMQVRGIVPELEIFDLGMVNYAKYLISKALLHPPYYANLFLGNIAGAQLDLLHAGLLIQDLPEETFWSLGGIGDAQAGATALAVAIGGGVRVGLEDSIYTNDSRQVLATNRNMVKRAHWMASAVDRRVMIPLEFRQLLHLQTEKGWYGR
jgi:3-keto-5-aminohexanoate cleavage enzyme